MRRPLLLLLACVSVARAEAPLMRDFIGEESPEAQAMLQFFVPVTYRLASFPEDSAASLVEKVRDAARWRSQRVPNKNLWITESLPTAADSKPASEEEVAAWVARSYLLLVGTAVERTHLTFQAAPAQKSYAIAVRQTADWLRKNLGDYRFFRVDREDAKDCFAYEFIHGSDPKKRIWVAWKPEGESHITRLYNDPLRIIRALRIPTTGEAEEVTVKQEIEGYMALEVGPRPVLIWLEKSDEGKKEEGKGKK